MSYKYLKEEENTKKFYTKQVTFGLKIFFRWISYLVVMILIFVLGLIFFVKRIDDKILKIDSLTYPSEPNFNEISNINKENFKKINNETENLKKIEFIKNEDVQEKKSAVTNIVSNSPVFKANQIKNTENSVFENNKIKNVDGPILKSNQIKNVESIKNKVKKNVPKDFFERKKKEIKISDTKSKLLKTDNKIKKNSKIHVKNKVR